VAATRCCARHLHGDISGGQPAASDGPFAVNVATTDAAGNTATATPDPTVDRGTTVAITGVEGGDNTINAAEAADGIVITGTAEAGSTVLVNGVPATVAANGTYTATLPAPTRGRPAPCTVTRPIAAGNTATDTRTLTRGSRHHGCDHGRGRRRQHDQRG
jgi:hypothetical protein